MTDTDPGWLENKGKLCADVWAHWPAGAGVGGARGNATAAAFLFYRCWLFLSALSSSPSGTLLGFTHRKQRAANFPKIVLFRAQTQECEDKQMAEPSPASLGCDTALTSGSGLAWSVPQLQTQTRRRVEVVAEIKKGVGIAAFAIEVRSNRSTALVRARVCYCWAVTVFPLISADCSARMLCSC